MTFNEYIDPQTKFNFVCFIPFIGLEVRTDQEGVLNIWQAVARSNSEWRLTFQDYLKTNVFYSDCLCDAGDEE